MSRFKRIANDLEKLPCELQEPILMDLEFVQLIHLSRYARERLHSSLTHSRSSWATLFRSDKITEWQELLAITEKIKKICFAPTRSDVENPYTYLSLEFLHFHRSDWGTEASWGVTAWEDVPDKLSRQWLCRLHDLLTSATWRAFHTEYSEFVEPWLSRLDGAADVFKKVHPTTLTRWTRVREPTASIYDLSRFIEFYQELRVIKARTFAEELYRLADLYDVHATRLRMPFAPQTQRPNLKHVSAKMRVEANGLVPLAENTWWSHNKQYPSKYRFAFPFPAIIPYDWTARLFDKVLQQYPFVDQVYPTVIVVKIKVLLEQPPRWDADVPVRVNVHPLAGKSISFGNLEALAESPIRVESLIESVKCWTHKHTRGRTSLKQGTAYHTHPERELKWLEIFLDVVAWMEVEFPHIVQEVRGYD